MKVKLTMKGAQYPQTADIAESELNKILAEGTTIVWYNEYKSKKTGKDVRIKHITILNSNAIITDVAFEPGGQVYETPYNAQGEEEIPE